MSFKLPPQYATLMRCLGPCEPPLAAYYTDTAPENRIGPCGGFHIPMDRAGDYITAALNYSKIMKTKDDSLRCMFQFIMETRRTGVPSVFNAENFGCPGFWFYSGYLDKLPEVNHYFVSRGIPALMPGERLIPSRRSSKKSSARLEGRTPKGTHLVFERIDRINSEPEIEVVVFFANPEIITGLAGLVRFAVDNDEAVRSIYGSGCASIFAWPMQLARQGREEAVLGVFDPAARPWLKIGEMTLAMPFGLFEKICASCKSSFMGRHHSGKSDRKKDTLFGWEDVLRRAVEYEQRMNWRKRVSRI
jgi:hypothetical protein